MSSALCSECIDDKFLRKIVFTEGVEGRCDVCGRAQPHTVTIDRLGELLAPLIKKHFRQGSVFPPDWGQEGDDLDSIVKEVLDQSFDFNGQIVDAVIAGENVSLRDGEVPLLNRGMNYVSEPVSESDVLFQWASLENELSTTHRFFSDRAESFYDELFRDVDDILITDDTNSDSSVATVIPTGFTVYRGRLCEEEDLCSIFREPFKYVGPPPPKLARAGRMSAEGISVFYGSTEKETCLAELRPSIGGQSAVIRLKTTRPLRMLDFTRMHSVCKSLSYFQPDFGEQINRFLFLRTLGVRISRPVVRGHEVDYLTTQTMMEYLAHVHRKPFDGVLFKSSQCNNGTNIVLFAKMQRDKPTFPLDYIAESLTIHSTNTISYEHEETKYTFNGETVQADWNLGLITRNSGGSVVHRRQRKN